MESYPLAYVQSLVKMYITTTHTHTRRVWQQCWYVVYSSRDLLKSSIHSVCNCVLLEFIYSIGHCIGFSIASNNNNKFAVTKWSCPQKFRRVQLQLQFSAISSCLFADLWSYYMCVNEAFHLSVAWQSMLGITLSMCSLSNIRMLTLARPKSDECVQFSGTNHTHRDAQKFPVLNVSDDAIATKPGRTKSFVIFPTHSTPFLSACIIFRCNSVNLILLHWFFVAKVSLIHAIQNCTQYIQHVRFSSQTQATTTPSPT